MTSNADTFEIHASDADHLLHDGYIGSPMADKPLIYEFRLSDLDWPEVTAIRAMVQPPAQTQWPEIRDAGTAP